MPRRRVLPSARFERAIRSASTGLSQRTCITCPTDMSWASLTPRAFPTRLIDLPRLGTAPRETTPPLPTSLASDLLNGSLRLGSPRPRARRNSSDALQPAAPLSRRGPTSLHCPCLTRRRAYPDRPRSTLQPPSRTSLGTATCQTSSTLRVAVARLSAPTYLTPTWLDRTGPTRALQTATTAPFRSRSSQP